MRLMEQPLVRLIPVPDLPDAFVIVKVGSEPGAVPLVESYWSRPREADTSKGAGAR